MNRLLGLSGFVLVPWFWPFWAWLVLQVLALRRLRGWPRALSAVPLLGMLPVLWFTADSFAKQSNLWPIPLIFSSCGAFAWTLFVYLFNRPAVASSPHEIGE